MYCTHVMKKTFPFDTFFRFLFFLLERLTFVLILPPLFLFFSVGVTSLLGTHIDKLIDKKKGKNVGSSQVQKLTVARWILLSWIEKITISTRYFYEISDAFFFDCLSSCVSVIYCIINLHFTQEISPNHRLKSWTLYIQVLWILLSKLHA
jgi:hypothetical protein